MTNFQGDQAPAKQEKMLKKIENSSMKAVTEQSMSSQTSLGSVIYGIFQEILTENLNMHRIAPSSQQLARPHVPENQSL
jgi:hypothetical protein